jgi:hypothetical protein
MEGPLSSIHSLGAIIDDQAKMIAQQAKIIEEHTQAFHDLKGMVNNM